MGCQTSYTQPSKQQLALRFKKLKFQLQLDMKNQYNVCCAKEKQLLQEFKKEKFYRSIPIENSLIMQIVGTVNRLHIYEITCLKIQKINTYSHHLGDQLNAVDTLYPSLRYLLSVEGILRNHNLSQMCQKIRKYNKELGELQESEINDEIVLYHKRKENPSAEMCNQYILKLCNAQNLNIQEVNSIGHKYRYSL